MRILIEPASEGVLDDDDIKAHFAQKDGVTLVGVKLCNDRSDPFQIELIVSCSIAMRTKKSVDGCRDSAPVLS